TNSSAMPPLGNGAFPTQDPFQSSLAGGFDAFVTKIKPDGSGIIYSTYLGGSSDDQALGVAVDSAGAAQLPRPTAPSHFPPTSGALQAWRGGPGSDTDAFVSKLSAAGNALIYSSYLGGSGAEPGSGIALDATGAAYVAGSTASTNFNTTTGAYRTTA